MIGLIYEWEQTAEFVTVNVQLPGIVFIHVRFHVRFHPGPIYRYYWTVIVEKLKVGISGKLAEIKIGEEILNVALPGNYLLRVYLFGLVNKDLTKVIIKPGNITINLKVKDISQSK